MAEANEAKVTGALHRLRMCLELCMKAACGQDLGLLEGDPLTHSPAVKAVVELRCSLERRINESDKLKVELKEHSSAAEVWKAELLFLNKLLGDCRKIPFGRPTEETKDIPPWMDKEMYLGIVENIRQLKANFDEASKDNTGDDLKSAFAQILRVALGEEKISADLLAVASTTLLAVQGLREKVDEMPDRETAQYREAARLHMKNKIDGLKALLGQCRIERDFLDDLMFTFNKVLTNERIKELDEAPKGIDPKYIEIGQEIIALAYKFREQNEQLSLCRKIAMGEAEQIDPIKGSAVEAVQNLRKDFKITTDAEISLRSDLVMCEGMATGEIGTKVPLPLAAYAGALGAVIQLREKFEAFKATIFKPSPPGPVPSRPPRPGEIGDGLTQSELDNLIPEVKP